MTCIPAMQPHMHMRGKAIDIRAAVPDGRKESAIEHAPLRFQLANHLLAFRAGAGTNLIAWFDNSANNPHNRNPSKAIAWGEQTWDETLAVKPARR